MCNISTGGSHLSAEHHQCLQLTLQVPGLVNVDFADVRAIMTNAGSSLMGQGRASGKARARDAALAAISSPLLDVGIERATGIVWNITGPSDLTLFEVRRELLNRVCSAQCSSHCLEGWAAWYNTWLLIELTPKGVVFSFLFFTVWYVLAPCSQDPSNLPQKY